MQWGSELLLLCLALGGMGSHGGGTRQFFLRQPDNQTAIEGEQVTLPCRVENKAGLLQWTRDGFGLGDTRGLVGYSRYTLVGSDDEKDWTLQISPVVLEDDALFQCQVGAHNGIKPVRSRNAQLTVYVPPEDPYIVQGSLLEVTEDREAVIQCVSPGGKPAADIYWHDGDGHVLVRDVHTTTTLLGDGKRFNTTSTVTFLPKKRHHNKTFTCSASNIADRSRRSTSLLLLVRYAPSVRLTTASNIGLLTEGETVQFLCEAQANPPPQTYTWFVDGQRANGFNSNFFMISNISQSYHTAIVKCEVTNEIGKSEETETILVRYGPKIITEPETVSGDLGDTVSLQCDVDSNPSPTYTWTKGSSRQAVGSSQNLTVIVSQRTEGQYFCHSITTGFPLLTTRPAQILLQGRPNINSPQTQTGESGSTVQVDCSATSAPAASSVMWTYMGRTIASGPGDPKYSIVKAQDGFKTRSTLLVRSASSEDFGYYGCTVTNNRGSAELSIRLEMEDKFPLLFLLVGVSATTILLLLATLLFLLCRRRLCPSCPPGPPDKPVKQNNKQSPPPLTCQTSVCGEEGWEDGKEASYGHSLSTYGGQHFQDKPDLISSGYVSYGSYGRDCPNTNTSFPTSDSQTSLHSASQLAANSNSTKRHSAALNVSDPRYSATYGNPYLRSPPKATHYATFSPTEPPASVLSPASTINSSLSYSRSMMTPPLPPALTGGSVMGIGPHSPQLNHRYAASGDLYAVVSRPPNISRVPGLTFQNNLTGGRGASGMNLSNGGSLCNGGTLNNGGLLNHGGLLSNVGPLLNNGGPPSNEGLLSQGGLMNNGGTLSNRGPLLIMSPLDSPLGAGGPLGGPGPLCNSSPHHHPRNMQNELDQSHSSSLTESSSTGQPPAQHYILHSGPSSSSSGDTGTHV